MHVVGSNVGKNDRCSINYARTAISRKSSSKRDGLCTAKCDASEEGKTGKRKFTIQFSIFKQLTKSMFNERLGDKASIAYSLHSRQQAVDTHLKGHGHVVVPPILYLSSSQPT